MTHGIMFKFTVIFTVVVLSAMYALKQVYLKAEVIKILQTALVN